MLEKPNTRF